MNSFDNSRVFIVLNLIGGVRDTFGNGKRVQVFGVEVFGFVRDPFCYFRRVLSVLLRDGVPT